MLKILLVYDDFQELTSVELMLKKIGFDVVGITSEFSLAEQLLSFNPQIIVAQGRTAKVSTANVGRRLRESVRWDGQSVLVFYPNAKPQATELLKIRMDVGLEYPVEPTKLVQVLAQLGSLDTNQLLDKLIKNMSPDAAHSSNKESANFSNRTETESVFVSGGGKTQEANQKIGGSASGLDAKSILSGSSESQDAKSKLSGSGANQDAKSRLGGAAGSEEAKSKIGGAGSADNKSGKSNIDGSSGADEAGSLKGSPDSDSEQQNIFGNFNPSGDGLQNPKGGRNSENSGPLFPLNKSSDENSSSNTGGKISNQNDDPNHLKNSIDANTFALNNSQQDPLMNELENLLQNKPDLSLNPPAIQDSARNKKYQEYMKSIPVQQLASIKRREAKLRLKDLIKDMDDTELKDQDVLRREYVKALFKKEG